MTMIIPPASQTPGGDHPHGERARWPALAPVAGRRSPVARLRARVARTLFRRAVSGLPVRVVLRGPEPGATGRTGIGSGFGRAAGSEPQMRIHRPEEFFARLGSDGLIGFGEAYMAGDWDAGDRSADLPELLTVLAGAMGTLVPPALQRFRPLVVRRAPAADDGDRAGARRNARYHYDLPNALFRLFLDETMTYSSALFEEDAPGHPARPVRFQDLAAAQRRKIDRLLDTAGVGLGTRLLEIGTGWGELALRAAARGAKVRSITLSGEQRAVAVQRVRDAGLAGQVTIDLCDYREAEGEYDAIVSVEMIEAVGEHYWPDYFRALDRLLAPGGRVGLQAITMRDDRMLAARRTHTWIQKYIFPGGLIPSSEVIEFMAGRSGLRVTARYGFGAHYAQTLRIWRERFLEAAEAADRLGFDPVFRRMWEFYLAYSEAGFRSGYLDVQQFALTRTTDWTGEPAETEVGTGRPGGAPRDRHLPTRHKGDLLGGTEGASASGPGAADASEHLPIGPHH